MLGVNVENLSPGVRAKRGERLPVVMSMPETTALLGAMSGTPRLMAALIYIEKYEMDALLAAPDMRTRQGFRDHAMLLFLYNSGARAVKPSVSRSAIGSAGRATGFRAIDGEGIEGPTLPAVGEYRPVS